jgi:DNA repair protein RecO (recombination protein O)
MLHKTKGVVFRFTRFGETSIIVNIFTAQFGLQGYIVKGVRSKASRGKIALFQPLSLLDMVVYHRANANLAHIREVKSIHLYQHVSSDVRKTTIALFISEILNKGVKDQSHAGELCDFLIESLIALDQSEKVENFHLVFLVQLSRWLGFQPQSTYEVLEGRVLDEGEEKALLEILKADYSTPLQITNEQRRTLLDVLVFFYARHIDGFGHLKSVSVLREILQ